MGDGYTLNERGKFLDDMNRLAKEMWDGETFVSVKPLGMSAPSLISSKSLGCVRSFC
jgi:hypothetical protein